MNLPEAVAAATEPLFAAYPLNEALDALVVTGPGNPSHVAIVEGVVADPAVATMPALCAGLWLYVDELNRSHVISQGIDDATGSFWHGIMHRREGDFGNSHYWFRRVRQHPALKAIPGYDPHGFIDDVERRYRQGAPDLVEMQRQEWKALFEWCCVNG
jgi:hypothetical protein